MKNMALLIILAAFSFYFYRFFSSRTQSTTILQEAVSKMGDKIEQETLPKMFAEMTVPYLRSRKYPTQNGALEKINTKSTHSTYLTHYTSDGLRINGLLTEPVGTPPAGGWPAIVFVHGYIAPTIYRTQLRYVDYVEYLARSGFVVFKIDLRGHGSSEGEPSGAYYSGGYVIDTLSAVESLKQRSFVNPERIGLWGHSMAGNVTLRTLAAKPDLKAVAIWGGAGFTYTDLLQYRILDTSYRPPNTGATVSAQRRQLTERYGQFDPTNNFWRTVAPTNYLGDINGAIGFFHAIDDPVVSIEHSRNLNALLQKTAISHKLHEYPNGGNNLSGATFNKAMQDTVGFYRKYL